MARTSMELISYSEDLLLIKFFLEKSMLAIWSICDIVREIGLVTTTLAKKAAIAAEKDYS